MEAPKCRTCGAKHWRPPCPGNVPRGTVASRGTLVRSETDGESIRPGRQAGVQQVRQGLRAGASRQAAVLPRVSQRGEQVESGKGEDGVEDVSVEAIGVDIEVTRYDWTARERALGLR